MSNPDALNALRQYVLTGHISLDLEMLRAAGFLQREAEQLLAANKVRELMQHYWFDEPLTIDNAERQLAKFNEDHRRMMDDMMRRGETG